MRIAVFHNLPSGGAKRALFNACTYLRAAGHALSLAVPDTADEGYLPLQGVVDKVAVFPTRRAASDAVGFCIRNRVSPLLLASKTVRRLVAIEACQRVIARHLNETNHDLVLVEQSQVLYSPFLLKHLRKPTVYFCQQPLRLGEAAAAPPARPRREKHLLTRQALLRLDRENASCASLILTNSCYSRESLLRQYGLESSVTHLGIDCDRFRPLGLERAGYVLSVGAIQPAKGFAFLVDALGRMEKRIRPPLLLIGNACSARERQRLEAAAGQADVALEVRVGVDERELVEIYNRAAAFVYAPRLEPFGLAVLEAMACGTPVLAVREGGVRESVVDGETGFLVDRDEEAFAERLAALLDDDRRRRIMGGLARDAVLAYWTVEKAGERLTRRMGRVLARGGR
jgi:glycosyltransferase involved in cell wall biosynthesis